MKNNTINYIYFLCCDCLFRLFLNVGYYLYVCILLVRSCCQPITCKSSKLALPFYFLNETIAQVKKREGEDFSSGLEEWWNDVTTAINNSRRLHKYTPDSHASLLVSCVVYVLFSIQK